MRSHRATQNRLAILRALSRFDLATSAELADMVSGTSRGGLHRALLQFVEDGLVVRDQGGRGCVAAYRITEEGRAEIKRLEVARAA